MMTDNDIIKALECLCDRNFGDCDKCPFYKHIDDDCSVHIIEPTLDLITSQKAKIEELKIGAGLRNNRKYYRKFVDEVFQKEKGDDLVYPDFDYIYQLYFEQKAEIERLEDVNIRLTKAEAIKEFAENVTYCKDCVNRELMTSNNQHFCNKFGGYVSEKDCCSRGVPCKEMAGDV